MLSATQQLIFYAMEYNDPPLSQPTGAILGLLNPIVSDIFGRRHVVLLGAVIMVIAAAV